MTYHNYEIERIFAEYGGVDWAGGSPQKGGKDRRSVKKIKKIKKNRIFSLFLLDLL